MNNIIKMEADTTTAPKWHDRGLEPEENLLFEKEHSDHPGVDLPIRRSLILDPKHGIECNGSLIT